MAKIYYNNLVANQNITARSNLVWTDDITDVKLTNDRKIYIFLCIDIHTNTIITHLASMNVLSSSAIVKKLSEEMDSRFWIERKNKLIIHTDRGTQFSSKIYNNFIKKYQAYMSPSMSRENTPTDNSVAERFMRTFKEYLIDGSNLQETLINSEFKYRNSIIRKYVEKLNQTPNKKTNLKGSQMTHNQVTAASMLMRDPKHTKAFSEHLGGDPRNLEIIEYKKQNATVGSILDEIAARKAEIVDRTPFDNFDDNLALKLIDQRLMELYELIQSNPLVIRNYVEDAIEPVNENIQEFHAEFLSEMEVLNKKIDMLLPKAKKEQQTQPLRDPVDFHLFPIFLANAGNSSQRKKDLRRAQLRITYTILYHCGLRINEIRHLNQEDLIKAIDAAQFNLIHHKTKEAHIHVLSKAAIQDLRDLRVEFYIVFKKYKYEYLYGKKKPITDKNLIKIVNKDLKQICKQFSIPFNIRSHSFRVNLITNLLKITSVQKTASIIGHADIRSTMSYNRYALTKTEIQDLLDQINKN